MRTAFHFRTAIRFNDFLKSDISVTPMANSIFWNHQHSCSHVMVFPTKCKPQLPDILSDSLRAGQAGDRIPVWTRFPAPLQTGPGAHPASYTVGTGSLPGVKRPGRGVDHPSPFRAEVKERVRLYLYSLSGLSRPNVVWPIPCYLYLIHTLLPYWWPLQSKRLVVSP